MTTCGGTGTYLPNYIHSYLRGFDLKPKNSTSFLHQVLVADILQYFFQFLILVFKNYSQLKVYNIRKFYRRRIRLTGHKWKRGRSKVFQTRKFGPSSKSSAPCSTEKLLSSIYCFNSNEPWAVQKTKFAQITENCRRFERWRVKTGFLDW